MNIVTDVVTFQTDMMEKKSYVNYKKFLELIKNYIILNQEEFDKSTNRGELVYLEETGNWEVVKVNNQDHTVEELIAVNNGYKEKGEEKDPVDFFSRTLPKVKTAFNTQFRGLSGKRRIYL